MDNVQELQESLLVTFSGLVAEVTPPDVPSGSAVICTDCDFTVQSVRTRYGTEAVYTFEGFDETLQAGSGLDIPVLPIAGAVWQNPENVTLNDPPTYTTVTLNQVAENPAVYSVDNTFVQSGFTPSATKSVTISGQDLEVGDAIVVIVTADNAFAGFTPAPPGVDTPTDGNGNTYLPIGPPANLGASGSTGFNVVAQPFYAINKTHIALGGTLTFAVSFTEAGGWSDTTRVGVFASACVAGITGAVLGMTNAEQVSADPVGPGAITTSLPSILFSIVSARSTTGGPTAPWVDPSLGSSGGNNMNAFYLVANTPGSYEGQFSNPSDTWANTWAIAFATATSAAPAYSDFLETGSYAFTIPSSSDVLGIQVTVSGQQSSQAPGDTMTLTVQGGTGTSPVRSFQLPATQGSVVIGGIGELFGQEWTPAQINNPGFGTLIQALSTAAMSRFFEVSAVEIEVWYSPPGLENFTYVKTFAMTDGATLTLALDNSGVFWQEDVNGDPDVLTPFFTAIEPNSFAKSVTQDDREFIAISDLMMGTDVPRQYNGQWVDRLSQVGPGLAPSVTSTSTTYPIVSITQPFSFDMKTDGESVLWSQGPTIQQAGNVVTLYFDNGTDVSQLVVGSTIVLSSFGGPFAALNNDSGNPFYVVTSIGAAKPLLTSNTTYPLITFTAPGTQLTSYTAQHQGTGDFGTVTMTLSQLTTSVPVPDLQVGGQMSIAGATPGTWNGTWTVFATPNAAQLGINTTSLSGNVATYDYTLISGTAPTLGQQVTVTDTSNGDGIFNVVNAVVISAGAGTFSVSIVSPDIPAAPETGNAIVNGTIFQFDPMQIIADGTGGEVVIAGGLGAGTRGAVVMFLTRNGLLTRPSPQAIFTLSESASQIIVTNLPIGPPNVIGRVVAFTGAGGATQSGGGGFYFWIPEPVTVTDEGQQVTYTSTLVNDNTSTQATFNFTDTILLAGASISSQGSNNFDQIELGSCLGLVSYGLRLFGWGVQNKTDNLLNYSFDGGIGQAIPPGGQGGSNIQTFPLGWSVDPASQQGVSVINSPIFGDALYIVNNSGSSQAQWGTITQPVYQDQNGAPIIFSAQDYSVRVTAEIPSGSTTGNLVVDLYSPTLTKIWGSFTIPFASLAQTVMTIETGTLLTVPFQQVPKDLVIRVYATGIAAGADVLVDRIEPFITDEPVSTTSLLASYYDNFEAFDALTSVLGVAEQNQQPVRNAFSLFDNLYIVKTGSFVSTTDNGITEPSGWTVREVSNKCGTPSINGVDVGEGWALIAGLAGVYIFEGGQPVKISPEIDPLWNAINWTYGHTLWIRNDTNNRRFTIGIPITTPNQWMPRFPVNVNPTQPNVVLMCNYKELMSAGAIQSEGPVRLTYTGELKTFSFGRKWAAWSIEAAYADFVTRPDTTEQLFYCTDKNQRNIFQQIEGLYSDDGEAMHCQYVTYAFPKPSEAQQMQMGLHQLIAHYSSLLIVGEGNLRPTIYPDSIDSEDAVALFPEPLANPPKYGDMELPINESGNRFFYGFEVTDVDEWFELSKIVMTIGADPWAPVRGSN